MKKLIIFLVVLILMAYFFQNEIKDFLKEQQIIIKQKYINPLWQKIKIRYEKELVNFKKLFLDLKEKIILKIKIEIEKMEKEWGIKLESFLKNKE